MGGNLRYRKAGRVHTGQRQSLGDEGALRMATAEIRHHVSTASSLAPREAALHSTPLRDLSSAPRERPAVTDSFNTILLQSEF